MFEDGQILISTIKSIVIQPPPNEFRERYYIHGYEHFLEIDEISTTDKEPQRIDYVVPPGC